jgi:hypothetical protein
MWMQKIGFLGVGFLGTILSWVLLSYFGRRTVYTTGLGGLVIILAVIGILDCVPGYEQRPAIIWAQSSTMVLWNFVYSLSVGPVCFVILCETSATKLRSKTIAIATAVQAICGIVMTVAIPHMINPDAGNLRGKIGFFFGVSARCYQLGLPQTCLYPFGDIAVCQDTNTQTGSGSPLLRMGVFQGP